MTSERQKHRRVWNLYCTQDCPYHPTCEQIAHLGPASDVCACVCVCNTHMYVQVHMKDKRLHTMSLLFSTLLFEPGSLTEPGSSLI